MFSKGLLVFAFSLAIVFSATDYKFETSTDPDHESFLITSDQLGLPNVTAYFNNGEKTWGIETKILDSEEENLEVKVLNDEFYVSGKVKVDDTKNVQSSVDLKEDISSFGITGECLETDSQITLEVDSTQKIALKGQTTFSKSPITAFFELQKKERLAQAGVSYTKDQQFAELKISSTDLMMDLDKNVSNFRVYANSELNLQTKDMNGELGFVYNKDLNGVSFSGNINQDLLGQVQANYQADNFGIDTIFTQIDQSTLDVENLVVLEKNIKGHDVTLSADVLTENMDIIFQQYDATLLINDHFDVSLGVGNDYYNVGSSYYNDKVTASVSYDIDNTLFADAQYYGDQLTSEATYQDQNILIDSEYEVGDLTSNLINIESDLYFDSHAELNLNSDENVFEIGVNLDVPEYGVSGRVWIDKNLQIQASVNVEDSFDISKLN